MPDVSVIVPNYNHARFLRQRLDSILAQTVSDFELILLDDGSTDESREILREYAATAARKQAQRRVDIRVEFNETNSGSTFKQWNKGVRLARGKYVWIAESDDYADPRLLELLAAILDSNPDVTFAYCRSRRVDDQGRPREFVDQRMPSPEGYRWSENFLADGRDMCEKLFCRTNPVPNASAVVFRRDVYERVGAADETLRLSGDWKLWAGMALQGRVAYAAEPLNYLRSHPASVRSRTELARIDVAEELQVCRWVIERVTLAPTALDRVRDILAGLWVPVMLSFKAPPSVKRNLWQQVRAIDPHPMRRVFRPALRTAGMKIQRHWRDLRSTRMAASIPSPANVTDQRGQKGEDVANATKGR
jgi:glycosyltransferase involved in cell wall biosynthesis